MSKTPCCPNRAQHGSWVRGSTDDILAGAIVAKFLPGPHLHANREKLMSRGLLELVRINVSNIKPCNPQCKHRLIPCIEISFFGQAQRDLSSCGKSRKDFLRPPVRKPTLVWARTAVWAVIPAQVVTPLETMESFDSETQLLARNKVVMSFRLRRTARLDLASAWNAQRSVSHSTTAPMSSTACVSARGTSQKTGRKPPRSGFSWMTNLPKFQPVPLNVTNSGYRAPTTV